MKNKLVLFLLFLPLILLGANVNVSVNKQQLTAGEELVVTITASGNNIKFPQITKIDGVTITGTSRSDNISIINGNMQESISQSYILYPTKSITIPSFNVYIDGKLYKTKPIFIKVTKPKQTKGNFELDINISKHNLYLGESAILTLKFIQKANASSIQIQQPVIKNFIIKQISSSQINKSDEKILIYKFLIIPQKSGTYEIGPLIAQVGQVVNSVVNNFFGLQIASMKYKNIYSNTIKIRVNDIPQNSIYGNFTITLKAKKRVKANQPNTAILTIKGCGDFYLLGGFNLNIPNVTIYPQKPIKSLNINQDKICGTFTQKFTIIADNNYTIPAITLNAFDGKLHILKTKPINVEVLNPAHPKFIQPKTVIQKKVIIEKKVVKNNTNPIIISIISLIVGIILGIGIYILYNKLNDEEIKKIKKANEKELLNILKKYEENDKIKQIMETIEENIYKNANNKIDKKEIIKIIKNIRKRR